MPYMKSPKRPWHNTTSNGPYRRKKKTDSFYSNQPWRKLRKRRLMKDPLCVMCKKEGRVVEANIVDHIRPKRFYPELELDFDNTMSLCKSHHESKSSKESRIKTKEQYEQTFKLRKAR